MCTAATFLSDDFYFGRNLDYEFSYGDEVTVTPRGYAFSLRRGDTLPHPLRYHRHGLCAGGLSALLRRDQ